MRQYESMSNVRLVDDFWLPPHSKASQHTEGHKRCKVTKTAEDMSHEANSWSSKIYGKT